MARIEEITTALDCFLGEFPGEEFCQSCTYRRQYGLGRCTDMAIHDAIQKLYERKDLPKKPIKFMDGLVERYRCECGCHLLYANYGRWNYCPKCGQAIYWEEDD